MLALERSAARGVSAIASVRFSGRYLDLPRHTEFDLTGRRNVANIRP
jgi:hypothetical protein